jgi:hypothetical protein
MGIDKEFGDFEEHRAVGDGIDLKVCRVEVFALWFDSVYIAC